MIRDSLLLKIPNIIFILFLCEKGSHRCRSENKIRRKYVVLNDASNDKPLNKKKISLQTERHR